MLKTVILKEIEGYFKSSRFQLLLIASVVLITVSIFAGAEDYKASRIQYNESSSMHNQQINKVSNYQEFAFGGLQVDRPPHKMGIIARGVEGVTGHSATVTTLSSPKISDSNAVSNLFLSVYGSLDLTYVVAIVLSLLAIMVGFDTVSGEKERGTLKLQLSNALPKDTLILGKLIGGSICLFVPIAVALAICIAWLSFDPSITLKNAELARICAVFTVFMLYASVFFALSIFISTLTSRSATSLLALLLIWIASTAIVPRLSASAARWISPAMTVTEKDGRLKAKTMELEKELQKKYVELSIRSSRELSEKKEDKAFLQQSMERYRNESDKIMEQFKTGLNDAERRIDEEFRRQNRNQAETALWLSRISPTAAMMNASMSIAGTGPEINDEFIKSLDEYRNQLGSFLDKRIKEENKRMMEMAVAQNASGMMNPPKPDISDMPRYEFKYRHSLKDAFASSAFDVLYIVIIVIALFIAAYAGFMRYDVR